MVKCNQLTPLPFKVLNVLGRACVLSLVLHCSGVRRILKWGEVRAPNEGPRQNFNFN